ncbi:MAG: Uma2 family endonuclease [Cyanobacteria bacterium P01_H01_bin.121]
MLVMIATPRITEPTIDRIDLDTYHGMIDAGIFTGRNIELLNGQLIEMPPESPQHANSIRKAAKRLRKLLGEWAEVSEGHPITLPHDGEPIPDIAVIKDLNYGDCHPGPSDVYLIIEYSNSTLCYDLGDKREAYAFDGIPEYWVANLNPTTVTVHRDPAGELYQDVSAHSVGEILTCLAFPNTAIAIGDLLA